MTPPPPPFGQPPRVPPSHVPTLTEVIELGPEETGGLSLEDTPAPAGPGRATQPATLEHPPAHGPASADEASAYPDLSDASSAPAPADADHAAPETPPGPAMTPHGPAAPHAGPVVAAPLPLPYIATGDQPLPDAPAPARFDAQPLTTEPSPVSPVFAAPPATWRADPELPAFLLAGRAATAPGELGKPGAEPAHGASAGSPAVLPPVTAAPVLPELAQALGEWPPAAPSPLPPAPAQEALAPVSASSAHHAGVPGELPVGAPPAAPAIAPRPETWREEQLVQQVLADVQRHADAMLEFRLREALGPVLARVTDELVRGARQEMAATLRDIVARAVAQELARQRSR